MDQYHHNLDNLYKDIYNHKITPRTDYEYQQIKYNLSLLRKITFNLDKMAKDYELKNDINTNGQKTGLNDQYALCYICRTKLVHPHDFYPKMCNLCGVINYNKRTIFKDQTGKIAIVTGGRVKIGFETALRLLRCNCQVVITTRFAKDALERYSKEKDYENWIHNLKIFEANFLSLDDTKNFIGFIFQNYNKIDYLINNAAQTIARPHDFYKHLLTASPDSKLIEQCIVHTSKQNLIGYTDLQSNNDSSSSSIAIQISDTVHFPLDRYDMFGQQLDLRDNNSWVQEIDEIEMKEFLQVQAINNITPYILTTKLIPLLKRENGGKSYIVNVTSMEGIFNYNAKTTQHVHTNMAKASLNMMTRTCGKYLANKHNIIMCAVETGWNNPQQPNSYDFKTPIDCLDGAMRILDPIFCNLKEYGIVYKDFQVHNF